MFIKQYQVFECAVCDFIDWEEEYGECPNCGCEVWTEYTKEEIIDDLNANDGK